MATPHGTGSASLRLLHAWLTGSVWLGCVGSLWTSAEASVYHDTVVYGELPPCLRGAVQQVLVQLSFSRVVPCRESACVRWRWASRVCYRPARWGPVAILDGIQHQYRTSCQTGPRQDILWGHRMLPGRLVGPQDALKTLTGPVFPPVKIVINPQTCWATVRVYLIW